MSLFQTLRPKPKGNGSTCLLLDVSGSMNNRIGTNDNTWEDEGLEPRRIELLFKAVRETPECAGLKAYVFSAVCRPIEVIPSEDEALSFRTESSTNIAEAFNTVKAAGFFSAILVTDGEPDSETAALQAASGMKLGIIYIGNPPIPAFLERLAKATDGTFQLADMRDVKQLESALAKALPPPDTTTPIDGGTIKL